MEKFSNLRPLITARINRSETVCFANEYSVRRETMSATVENINVYVTRALSVTGVVLR